MKQLEIGDRIGPYEIRECLGEGGMAAVYKAWHTGLHRFEALKIPRANGGTPDAAFVQRLLAEARTAASLHHPHIVGIHNVSEPTAPQPFFAMDFIAGSDLAKILAEKGRFSASEALQILEPVGAALDHAHAAGIIHRDVKPANILLTRTPNETWAAKVVDFGISRAAEDDDIGATKLTKSGMIVGTPEYMSPEQSGSGEPVDSRTDIYSLAIVAYEMLCGGPPFTAGQGVSRLAILVKHVRDEPNALAGRCEGVSDAVNAVILKGLEKHPANRFQSCSAFVGAFQEAIEVGGEPVLTVGATSFDAPRFAPVDAATIMERPGVGGSNRTLPIQPAGEKTAVLEVAPILPAPGGALDAFKVFSEPVLAPEIVESALPVVPVTAPVSPTRRVSRAPLWAGLGGLLAGGLFVYALMGGDTQTPEIASKAAVARSIAPKSVAPPVAMAIPMAQKPPVAAPKNRVERSRQVRAIPFATQIRRSAQRPVGSRFVQQRGQNGTRELIFAVTYRGQQEMARQVESSRVTREPQPQIVVLGTKTVAKTAPRPRFRPRPVVRAVPKKRPVIASRPRPLAPRYPPWAAAKKPGKKSFKQAQKQAKKVAKGRGKRGFFRDAPLPP